MKLRVFALIALPAASANSTETWKAKRIALIDSVYGSTGGALPTRSKPDRIITWPGESPGLQGLVWNLSTMFEITSTVFYSPITPGKKSKNAFMFHHGHSNCVGCPTEAGEPSFREFQCRPGCNSSMPSGAEKHMSGYSWWDLYNVSDFFHSQGFDVFILSMPLKGVNLGPGSSGKTVNSNHWWFLQWEEKGDHPLRYFLEPCVLTMNFAKEQGYQDVYMAGLSGGGWTTTFAPAIDKRIKGSFPIAGSVPCAMRNPLGRVPGQNWTGSDAEDYEQSCMPSTLKPGRGDDNPGRPAFAACNYTCQYLLAGLEPGRFQVQILHERDSCCFSPQGRHNQMLNYQHNIRAELQASDRQGDSLHGWFTTVADDHTKHEVCAQDKTIISAVASPVPGEGGWTPGSIHWEQLPCDIMRQSSPPWHVGECAANVEPGQSPPTPPKPPQPTPRSITHCKHPPCVVATDNCSETASQLWHLNEIAIAPQGLSTAQGKLFRIVHEEKGLCMTALAMQTHAKLTLSPCQPVDSEVTGAALQYWTADADNRVILANSSLALNVGIPLFSPISLLQIYPVQAHADNEVFVLPVNASTSVHGQSGGAIKTSVPAGGCLDVL